MLIPRYASLPTVRGPMTLDRPAPLGQPPVTTDPPPDAGQIVLDCLRRRGIAPDARTPLVTLLCAADETRPLVAELKARAEMFGRWVAAFEAGTTRPRYGDTEAERRYRRTREAVITRATAIYNGMMANIKQFDRAIDSVEIRLREYVAQEERFDAIWPDLEDPADIEEFRKLRAEASQTRLDFYQNVVFPLLIIAVDFVAIARQLSVLSSQAIKQDAQWMVTVESFLTDTIAALKRAENKGEGLWAKISKLVFGEDPMGTILAGVVVVGIGLAAIFLLPPLFRGLGERLEAKAKPKRLTE